MDSVLDGVFWSHTDRQAYSRVRILIVLLNTILLAFPSSAKWENSRFLNKFFMGNVSKLPDVRFAIEIIYPYQILDLTFVLYDELVNGGLA